MKSASSFGCLLLALLTACGRDDGRGMPQPERTLSAPANEDDLRRAVLREAALRAGFVRADTLEVETDSRKRAVGALIFASPLMSLNSRISCQDCHRDEFGSADGLPNAVGAGGNGHGAARLNGSEGKILPRNALPFWGRGSKGFHTFFWDGRVRLEGKRVASQFGENPPSSDPFITAVHLPSVEVREMIVDTPGVRRAYVKEDVKTADTIHQEIAQRFARDAAIGPGIASAYGRQPKNIRFIDVADALAQFIRHRFRIQSTPLERFVFDNGPIREAELAGGILFYGRGRCVQCHNGPYFSDLAFHAVAFPQAGFGKNGFGIDEGRFNTTLDPADRFLFRTPPLFNVAKTAPYSHSGSVGKLEDAIIAHFDPLRFAAPTMTLRERADFFQRLGAAANETLPSALSDREVSEITAFLQMLSFEPR